MEKLCKEKNLFALYQINLKNLNETYDNEKKILIQKKSKIFLHLNLNNFEIPIETKIFRIGLKS